MFYKVTGEIRAECKEVHCHVERVVFERSWSLARSRDSLSFRQRLSRTRRALLSVRTSTREVANSPRPAFATRCLRAATFHQRKDNTRCLSYAIDFSNQQSIY